MAYGFNKKNLCKKPLRFYHCSILNLIFYETQSEKKKQTVALAPPPLVFLNYGSAVVTFNLWKYPLIRLVFAEINFRVDFYFAILNFDIFSVDLFLLIVKF